MLDVQSTTYPALQRVKGAASVRFAPGGVGARLVGLSQSGSAKCLLPKVHGDRPEAVFLNTAGGITGGDRLTYDVTVEAGARAVATTQTAERAYASVSGQGRIETRLRVGAGAVLDWLPQEVILFNDSATTRHLHVDLADGAEVTLCESLVLGRAAMGEVLTNVTCLDRREVWHAGRPILIEPLDVNVDVLRDTSAAGLAGATVLATLIHVSPRAEAFVAPLRAAPVDATVRGAVSCLGDVVILRLMGQAIWPVKTTLARAAALVTGRGVPRVWQV